MFIVFVAMMYVAGFGLIVLSTSETMQVEIQKVETVHYHERSTMPLYVIHTDQGPFGNWDSLFDSKGSSKKVQHDLATTTMWGPVTCTVTVAWWHFPNAMYRNVLAIKDCDRQLI